MPINSIENSLATLATSQQAGNVQQQIGSAVLKQLMDNQKMQAEALIKMINATHPPSLDGTGENVNVGA